MSEINPPPSSEALQFDKAEVVQTAGPVSCSACKQVIGDHYFEINGAITCLNCRDSVVNLLQAGFNLPDFIKALGVGSAAALAGAILWYVVTRVTGYQLGIIAIVVGLMVGKAIQWVIRGRGGLPFQILAVVLTYCSIASSYIPMLVSMVMEQAGSVTFFGSS